MKKSFLPGIIFIIAAFLLILSILNIIPSDIPWFSIIVAFIMVIIIINAIRIVSFYGIFIPLSIILMLFKSNLQLEYISNFEFFLVGLLLAIGCTLLFKRKRYFYTGSGTKFYFSKNLNKNNKNNFEDDSNGIITYASNFSTSNKTLKDIEVAKIIINNNFGQFTLNIEEINIINNPLEIYIKNNSGKIILNIKNEYYVNNQIKTTLGNEIKINKQFEDGLILGNIILKGDNVLGSIEVNKI